MKIELHMIQSFAPSNLNRDDTNSPKDCEFGGVRRARISSQCIKRAIRNSPAFSQTVQIGGGSRTRWLTRLIEKPLVESGKPFEECQAVATAFAAAYSGKMDKDKKTRTSVLLYLSGSEIDSIVGRLNTEWDLVLQAATYEKPEEQPIFKKMVDDLIKETRGRTSAPDIALFGRMLADKPELSLDAACQVAHAISTHHVSMEMDFFTAVDDLQQSDEAGAGMMGFIGFNSATFYRYACLDWSQLVKNLDGDLELARCTVEGFLRAALDAVPTGKQNSFAAQNPPSFAMAVVRTSGPCWSLANAFERPVRPSSVSGLVGPSISALDNYWGRLVSSYGEDGLATVAAIALEHEQPMHHLKSALVSNHSEWLAAVLGSLTLETPA